jgi:hypothetical protein
MQSFKLSESQSGSCPNRLVAWYAWRWTVYHLVQTGRKDELRRLLLDFDYLQAKLSTTDANGLIADYDFLADEKELRVIHPERRVLCSIGSANAEIIFRVFTKIRSHCRRGA